MHDANYTVLYLLHSPYYTVEMWILHVKGRPLGPSIYFVRRLTVLFAILRFGDFSLVAGFGILL